MKGYSIITDAAADIPYEIIEQGFGVTVIPMAIQMKDDIFYHYPDFRDMTPADFYPKMRMGALPTTKPITKESYTEAFEKIIEAGKDVIYIGISGGLSESIRIAEEAAGELMEKYPSAKISVIDSKNASTGQGLLVLEAVRHKEGDISYEAAVEDIRNKVDKVRCYFFVDDIFHLKRGGRISRTEHSAAAALKIRTIFTVDSDGKLIIKTKARGNQNAIEYISKVVCEEADKDYVINIASAAGSDRVEKLKTMIINGMTSGNEIEESELSKRLFLTDMSLISGTHTGPGTVAAAYFVNDLTNI